MHSGFFRLKHTFIIAEQKKLLGRFPMAAILPKNSQVTIAKWSQSLLSPDVCRLRNHDIFSSQNPIENCVVIILSRFPINETQK